MRIMNLETITDVKELKSLAYDQIVALEQAQNNLRLINARLAQLEQEETDSQTVSVYGI